METIRKSNVSQRNDLNDYLVKEKERNLQLMKKYCKDSLNLSAYVRTKNQLSSTPSAKPHRPLLTDDVISQLQTKLFQRQKDQLSQNDRFFREIDQLKRKNNQLLQLNKQLQLDIFSGKLQLDKEKAKSEMLLKQLQRLQKSQLAAEIFRSSPSAINQTHSQKLTPVLRKTLSLLRLSLQNLGVQHNLPEDITIIVELERELNQLRPQLEKSIKAHINRQNSILQLQKMLHQWIEQQCRLSQVQEEKQKALKTFLSIAKAEQLSLLQDEELTAD